MPEAVPITFAKRSSMTMLAMARANPGPCATLAYRPECAVGNERMDHTRRHCLNAQPTEGDDVVPRGPAQLAQRQAGPGSAGASRKGGAPRSSHRACHLVGRVKARPHDQYFLRWLARL